MADQEPTTPARLRQADPFRDFYVYHLLDEGGTPFYAGCTRSGERYARHLKFARKELARNKQVEKNEIIVMMLDSGIEPGFRKIAEGLSQDEGHALERAEIARIGRLCLGTGPLANSHDGGGMGDGHHRSQAAQARRIAARAETL